MKLLLDWQNGTKQKRHEAIASSTYHPVSLRENAPYDHQDDFRIGPIINKKNTTKIAFFWSSEIIWKEIP